MEAAILAMIAAMFVAVLGSIYEQRREGSKLREEGAKTRGELNDKLDTTRGELNDKLDTTRGELNDKLDANTEALRDLASRMTVLEASHQHLLQDFAEHRRITEKNHNEVTGSLADARERLARIEGHLGLGIPPPGAAES